MVDFRLRNDLDCVGWGVKLYSLTHSIDASLIRTQERGRFARWNSELAERTTWKSRNDFRSDVEAASLIIARRRRFAAVDMTCSTDTYKLGAGRSNRAPRSSIRHRLLLRGRQTLGAP